MKKALDMQENMTRHTKNRLGRTLGMALAVVSVGWGLRGEVAVAPKGSLEEWIETCRELARRPPSEDIGACESSCTYSQKYDVVYVDDRHLSFRGEEYWHEGGAHGNRKVSVGTFDRRTGRRLAVADLVPASARPALRARLREAVARKLGGEEHLQASVEAVENFYFAKDGVHFVYNEYEVACFAAGVIDVTVDLKGLSPTQAR